MTRVNVGIHPIELCDQHLVAEYRELPRCFSTRTNAGLKGFRLGKGHQLWCAQYQLSCARRQAALCDEMRRRGFTVNYPMTWQDFPKGALAWSPADESAARPLLIARIRERLSSMRPTWTGCTQPAWAR